MSKGSLDKGSSEECLQPTVDHKVKITMLGSKEKQKPLKHIVKLCVKP